MEVRPRVSTSESAGRARKIGENTRVFFAEHAGPDTAAEHRRREAGSLFVRPVDDRERRVRLHVVFVERLDDFERRVHANDAVVLAACGLCVEVRAHRDWRKRGCARTHGEDVPNGVDLPHDARVWADRHGW